MKDTCKLAAVAITAGASLLTQPASAFFGMMDDFFGNDNDDYYDGYGPYGYGGPHGWGGPYGYGGYPGVQQPPAQSIPAPLPTPE